MLQSDDAETQGVSRNTAFQKDIVAKNNVIIIIIIGCPVPGELWSLGQIPALPMTYSADDEGGCMG